MPGKPMRQLTEAEYDHLIAIADAARRYVEARRAQENHAESCDNWTAKEVRAASGLGLTVSESYLVLAAAVGPAMGVDEAGAKGE